MHYFTSEERLDRIRLITEMLASLTADLNDEIRRAAENGVSIDRIAKAAGVSRPTIYRRLAEVDSGP